MASTWPSLLFHLIHIPVIVSLLLVTTQAETTINLGLSLYANDDSITWNSSSGDFAFGFRKYPNQADQFFLAIWFAKIPNKTVVWSANASNPVPRGSKLELTTSGQLMLTNPGGGEIWATTNNYNNFIEPSEAAMLDSGNFVIRGKNSSMIWESFRNPTNTILPTQVLNFGDKLSSGQILGGSFLPGKFELVLLTGHMVLQRVDPETGHVYGVYDDFPNVTQLISNESGDIYANRSDNSTVLFASWSSIPTSQRLYHRTTLDYDGTFTRYIHPRDFNSNESWSVAPGSVVPDNICMLPAAQITLGSGPCGFNSYCEPDGFGKPICGCPPSFSFVDQANLYSGCKQNDAGYIQQLCEEEGSTSGENLFDFDTMDGVDWREADYELRSPSTEDDCRRACAIDCNCDVAVLQDPMFNNGTGSCWKKKVPLSNGWLNRSSIDRRALFKKLKNASQQLPTAPSSDKNRSQAILILSVLLGTSAFFNFFSVAALFACFYFFYRRRMYEIVGVQNQRDLETNLRAYSYMDLEKATNNFKEELGRGAFGTVYKGLLPSGSGNYVAVKKLDKVIQEGQKEFISEMKTISQTHHKNLVRLLGYCDEGEHRLLVYEFMQNGSLSGYLFGSLRLSWQQRVQIASGIAKGLVYLHEECSKQIIHCDIKPQNILLDDLFTAKISDFGLAKLLHDQTRTLTGVRGTKGYVAPEWFRNTPVTAKVDVYSFGVMLLEIISCRKCVDFEMEKEAILADWAYECLSRRKVEKLVEGDEEAKGDPKRLEKLVMVAIWCVQDDSSQRPSMRMVSLMLEGIVEVPRPPCPFNYSSLTSSD